MDIGTVARYSTPDGKRVSAMIVEESADLPRYDIEVVDDGEVVEHLTILGSYVLDDLARRRRWTRVTS